MTIEVTDVLNQIKEKFINPKKKQISIRKLPSYLTSFIKEDRRVIFIHHEGEVRTIPTLNLNNTNNTTTLTTFDGDITGNPLEGPDEYDPADDTILLLNSESSESSSHYPVPISEARSILAQCAINIKPSLPVWILTDGNDFTKLLASFYEVNGEWITYGGIKECEPDPTLEKLLEKHNELSNFGCNMPSCEARCTFIVKNDVVIQEPSLLHKHITLHASWTKMCLIPPIEQADVKLKIKLRVGHECGGLKALWEQICLIDKYLEIEAGRCSSVDLSLPSCEAFMASMKKKLTNTPPASRIAELIMEPVDIQDVFNKENELDKLVNLIIINQRPSSTTDCLWLLFIECKTLRELSLCLESFYNEMTKPGREPLINVGNISSLGKDLSDGFKRLRDPLRCLIEMGLEKMKNDMLKIFTAARIVTVLDLNIPNIPNFSDVSEDWNSTARKWHLWLCQAHCALEVLWSIQEAFSLSTEQLWTLAPNIVRSYVGKKIDSFASLLKDPIQEVECVARLPDIMASLDNLVMEDLVFSLTTSLPKRRCHNTFFRTTQNHFPNVILQGDNKEEDPSIYHGYEYRYVSDYFSS